MNFDFFSKFSKFQIAKHASAEDFSDRFHYQMTSAILVTFVSLISLRDYFFTPLQCWIPYEWAKSWEEFSEAYCWLQDTYFAKVQDGPQEDLTEREEAKFCYYQWFPFILGFQALIVYLPHLIWKLLSNVFGTNLNRLIRCAAEVEHFDDEKRSKVMEPLGREIRCLMSTKVEGGLMQGISRKKRVTNNFLKRRGVHLIALYILMKILYICVDFGQLFLMMSFLGVKRLDFGAQLLYDVYHGKTWEKTGIFPRVTYCDVPRRVVGNTNLHSIMCVLPSNMLNEKIYIFMWFWIFAGLLLTFVSLAMWCVQVFLMKERTKFIRRFLSSQPDYIAGEEDANVKKFLKNFLRRDGVFLLRMISKNCSELIASDIIVEVFKQFKEQRQKLSKEIELENDNV